MLQFLPVLPTLPSSKRKLNLPYICLIKKKRGGSSGSTVVKNTPANARNARDSSSILGWEDPLEEEMAIYSNILAWKISWTEEPSGLQSMGLQRVEHS